jgi:hypothetical protein
VCISGIANHHCLNFLFISIPGVVIMISFSVILNNSIQNSEALLTADFTYFVIYVKTKTIIYIVERQTIWYIFFSVTLYNRVKPVFD